VLFTHKDIVLAAHAGWRGLAGDILLQSLDLLKKKLGSLADVQAFIGPYIQQDDFEVGEDVAQQLQFHYEKCHPEQWDLPNNLSKTKSVPGKFLADLGLLAHAQLINKGLPESNILDLKQNTYAQNILHSFRRDGQKAGRQISFVTRLA
jgi:copper oxidase (laccase) domain-containing protein